MLFVIETTPVWGGENATFTNLGIVPSYTWRYERADGEVICRGQANFSSEKECRSNIAAAKVAMKSARFAKTTLTNPGGTASVPPITSNGKD